MLPEFAALSSNHFCANVAGPHLETKADSQNWNTQIKNLVIKRRRFGMH